MRAIILAAGVGKRLRPFTDQHPKCLLQFGGKTLLEHHLDHLSASGVDDVTIVVGHLCDQVEDVVSQVACPVPVNLILNPQYNAGSGLSLLAAAGVLTESSSLVMDADVLCGQDMFRRLILSRHPDCLLVDSSLDDTGEEVKVVALSDRRVWELGKSVRQKMQVVGESVGLFKFTPETGKQLASRLYDATQSNPDIEYEPVIDSLLKDVHVGYETVDDLPWIEIDFWEDLERARSQVFRLLAEADSVVAAPNAATAVDAG